MTKNLFAQKLVLTLLSMNWGKIKIPKDKSSFNHSIRKSSTSSTKSCGHFSNILSNTRGLKVLANHNFLTNSLSSKTSGSFCNKWQICSSLHCRSRSRSFSTDFLTSTPLSQEILIAALKANSNFDFSIRGWCISAVIEPRLWRLTFFLMPKYGVGKLEIRGGKYSCHGSENKKIHDGKEKDAGKAEENRFWTSFLSI